MTDQKNTKPSESDILDNILAKFNEQTKGIELSPELKAIKESIVMAKDKNKAIAKTIIDGVLNVLNEDRYKNLKLPPFLEKIKKDFQEAKDNCYDY